MVKLDDIQTQVSDAVEELVEVSGITSGDIFVLGMSTSEVKGEHIGDDSNLDIGRTVIKALLDVLKPKGIHLGVQGCEHLNRAVTVEKDLAKERHLEMVNVKPTLHAGGAGQMAAFEAFDNPIEVEFITADAGIDIGDTEIGMHIKHVQVPVRLETKYVGNARVTALRSRLKKIGGERAEYF